MKHSSLFAKKLSPTFFASTAFWSNKDNITPIVESLFHRNLGSISFLDRSFNFVYIVACSSTVMIKKAYSLVRY